MKNKLIISSILFVLVLGFSFYALSQNKKIDNVQNQSQTGGQNERTTPSNQNQTSNQNPIAENTENKIQNNTESKIIFFYGNGCPHCALVEEYFKTNNIHEKISFEEKEVYYNQQNAQELIAKAKLCGIKENAIGVPFLWDGKTCIIGDRPIIDFFNNLLKNNSSR